MPAGNISIFKLCRVAVMWLLLPLLAHAPVYAQQPVNVDPTKNMRPVTDEMLLHPDPATG